MPSSSLLLAFSCLGHGIFPEYWCYSIQGRQSSTQRLLHTFLHRKKSITLPPLSPSISPASGPGRLRSMTELFSSIQVMTVSRHHRLSIGNGESN
ncbi:uncharacterized protein BO87DRAFT_67594 [Aspergillus neoniger CBS 115656]|uniref:Secreted protein n=1 Tax=Aspergillus neoniger (strain CBS 115656) TaxID=1448310 RepID=A0A318YID7_ASPNB|nr:hypothetical protein BO87DRAFT_67594 [Aspergillus neoniger CBS 115656]PYH33864.1 hypothetical protein BO87DRAFT_67594 [Aspergillus neoniger CBS 115656]